MFKIILCAVLFTSLSASAKGGDIGSGSIGEVPLKKTNGPTFIPSKGVFEGTEYVGFVKELLYDWTSEPGCHDAGATDCYYPKVEKTLLSCKADILFTDGRKVPSPGGSGQIVIERIKRSGYPGGHLINFKFIYVATTVSDAGHIKPVYDNSDAEIANNIAPWYGGPSWFRGNRAAQKIIKDGCHDYDCPILVRIQTATEMFWPETEENSYDPQSKTYKNKFGAAGMTFDNETRTLTMNSYGLRKHIGSLIPHKELVVRCSDKP